MYDTVDFHLNIYVKEIIVRNLEGRDREIRLFFNHDFHIYENEIGDTAYYDPDTRAIVHYKSQRYFLINCCDPTKCGVDHFATGIKELRGTEGTGRDAEDGLLSGNPIAQGSVDSTVALHAVTRPEEASVVYYWMAAGTGFEEVAAITRAVVRRGPEDFLGRTRAYWELWVDKSEWEFGGIPGEVTGAFRRGLLVLRP